MKWFGTPFQIIHTFSKSDFSFTIEKHDLVEDGFDKLLPKLHLKGLKLLLENGVLQILMGAFYKQNKELN